MNVGQLKKILAKIPDNVQLFRSGSAHEMREIWSAEDYFVTDEDGSHWEFFGDAYLEDGAKKIRVVIIE